MADSKEAGGNKQRPAYASQAFIDRIGPCPLCQKLHFYKSKKSRSKGKLLVSTFLSLCPLYVSADVNIKLSMIENNNGCTLCTNRRHTSSACNWNPPRYCRTPDCLEKHNPSLPRASSEEVMVIKSQDDLNKYDRKPKKGSKKQGKLT